MLNFEFQVPTRVIFGRDTHKEVGAVVKPMAKKVLLHYGGSSIKKNGVYDDIVASLQAAGVDRVELGGVQPNPRVELVRQGADLCKREGVELVLAVGGGSVIDSAKAIALGACYDGDVWDVFEQGLPITNALPVVTVLTLPASGSESSRGSLIVNREKQMKLGYINALLRPKISIVNPALFFSLPQNQVANGVSDMMSHIMERYFTATDHTDVVDGLCEGTLRAIMKNGLAAYGKTDDYDAWGELGLAGTLAHNNLLGIGRQQDWACHDMEQELNPIFDTPHGAGLAVLTPYWMEYIYKDHMDMFLQFAVNVMGVEGGFRQPEEMVQTAIDRLRDFYQKLGLPATLRQLGISDRDKLAEAARKATGKGTDKERTLGGLHKLCYEDVLEIFNRAMG